LGMGTWLRIEKRIGKRIAPQHESSCFAWSLEFVFGIMIRSIALHEAMNCILLSLRFTDCSRFHVQRKASLPKSTSSFISYHIASNNPCHSHAYSNPFLANSTFLAASPALNPPLLTHAMLPSPNSILSSTSGNAQGQWCGKCTQLRVCGQRYLSQCAEICISDWSTSLIVIK
jgi:hypothetical protein